MVKAHKDLIRCLKRNKIHFNGLFKKINEIRILLQEIKIDVLAITEIHLSSDIPNDKLKVTGYSTSRCDQHEVDSSRDNDWGGCIIYYSE